MHVQCMRSAGAMRVQYACALYLHARAQQRLELGAALQVLGVRRAHRAQVAPLDLEQPFQLGHDLTVPRLVLGRTVAQLLEPLLLGG